MSFKLTVPDIKKLVFDAYYYGYGTIVEEIEGSIPDTTTFVIDYEDDEYRCRYQDGRFASGGRFCKVEESK